jgi:hypothetical protein
MGKKHAQAVPKFSQLVDTPVVAIDLRAMGFGVCSGVTMGAHIAYWPDCCGISICSGAPSCTRPYGKEWFAG